MSPYWVDGVTLSAWLACRLVLVMIHSLVRSKKTSKHRSIELTSLLEKSKTNGQKQLQNAVFFYFSHIRTRSQARRALALTGDKWRQVSIRGIDVLIRGIDVSIRAIDVSIRVIDN